MSNADVKIRSVKNHGATPKIIPKPPNNLNMVLPGKTPLKRRYDPVVKYSAVTSTIFQQNSHFGIELESCRAIQLKISEVWWLEPAVVVSVMRKCADLPASIYGA